MQLAETLVLDLLEQVVVEQFFDERVLERLACDIRRGQLAEVGGIEQIGGKACREVCSRRSTLSGLVPDFEPLQPAGLGLR